MADVILSSKIQIRNDTQSNWITNNPILLKGEIGIEIDKNKFKIGDGINTYTQLKYANGGEIAVKTKDPDSTDTDYEPGTIWVNTQTSNVFIYSKTGSAFTWRKAIFDDYLSTFVPASAGKLTTARTIGITGDGSGSTSFDGSANASISLVLKNSGVNAGTYTKLTVNAKGIVTAAEQISESDLPNISASKITGLGTAATRNVGVNAGNVVEVLSGGKIDENLLPALAITDVFEVSSQSAMLALNAQTGDVAVRTDENKSYILSQSPASTLSNWKLLRTPTDIVLSVNSKTGAVVLTTSDISEGSNLYYTEARATANFNTNFASKSSAGLTDGATILHSTDTFILNGGTSA